MGLLFSGFVLAAASHKFGGASALLRVGTLNPQFREFAAEIGPLSMAEPIGHDGQLFYAIARDPRGRKGTPAAIAAFDGNGPRYRYRRILYPALAGGFGHFSGRQTLLGMMSLVVLGFGVSGLALADLSRQGSDSERVLWAIANPGLLGAAYMLVADPLAVGFALGGVALSMRARWRSAGLLFALAGLTKEIYVLVSWSVAAWLWTTKRDRRALTVAWVPTLPVALWSAYLWLTMPRGQELQNFGWPFQGLGQAFLVWIESERSPFEWGYLGVATVFIVRGVQLMRTGNSLTRWLVGPWLVIACTASIEVWGKPNNAARALALLWPLTILAPISPEDRCGVSGASSDGHHLRHLPDTANR